MKVYNSDELLSSDELYHNDELSSYDTFSSELSTFNIVKTFYHSDEFSSNW